MEAAAESYAGALLIVVVVALAVVIVGVGAMVVSDAARNGWTEDQAVMVSQMAAALVRRVHSSPVGAFQAARMADGILSMVVGVPG